MRSFAFSPDSKILASVSEPTISFWDSEAMISFWDTATGERLRDIKPMAPINTLVAFSPDSQRLVFGSHRGLHFLMVSTGEEELFFEVDEVRVKDLVFLPDGEKVLMLQEHNNLSLSVSLIDMFRGEQRQLDCSHGEQDLVALSPSGTMIAWVSLDESISLQDTMANTLSHRIASRGPSVNDLVFSPDGKFLASINKESVRIWNTTTKEKVFASDREIYTIAISPNGQLIGTINLVYQALVDLSDIKIHQQGLENSDSETNFKADSNGPGLEVSGIKRHGRTRSFEKILFSPNGQTVCSAATDEILCIWDPTTGRKTRDLRHEDAVRNIIYSSDSNSIISLSGSKSILIWVTFSASRTQLAQHGRTVKDIVLSPDGKTLASVTRYMIQFWDLLTAQKVQDIAYCSMLHGEIFPGWQGFGHGVPRHNPCVGGCNRQGEVEVGNFLCYSKATSRVFVGQQVALHNHGHPKTAERVL
jgi:WD40 repeat protein